MIPMPTKDEKEASLRAIAFEDYKSELAEAQERLKYQVEFSQSTLKNLHLVNGGAILALLTFFGNTDFGFDHRALWWAFVWFGSGLASSLAAYFGAYFSQACFTNQSLKQAWNAQLRVVGGKDAYDFTSDFKIGNRYLYIGIGAATGSLVSFIIGSFVALSGLK